MSATPVEWILAIFYGPSAHRATYGRLRGTQYTKDFIQLTRKPDFVAKLTKMFPPNGSGVAQLTYRWPSGTAPGQIVYQSADRPHLSWETRLGAPAAWKMAREPSDVGPETIPGNPSLTDPKAAEAEYAAISGRGGGQPYLLAIKLQGEQNILHLRAYLAEPNKKFAWADINLTPMEIRALAAQTSCTKALAWSAFGLGLFFDPSQNHDAWQKPTPRTSTGTTAAAPKSGRSGLTAPELLEDDLTAETLAVSTAEVEAFDRQIDTGNYAIDDLFVTSKTRSSAQRAFADKVKNNYELRCAITGISTKAFLVAAHIVPWSHDQSIRLDPSNGICLSLLMDRAFENGYLIIEDDLSIVINWKRVGTDTVLQSLLKPYDGKKLTLPRAHTPKPDYLRRRKQYVSS